MMCQYVGWIRFSDGWVGSSSCWMLAITFTRRLIEEEYKRFLIEFSFDGFSLPLSSFCPLILNVRVQTTAYPVRNVTMEHGPTFQAMHWGSVCLKRTKSFTRIPPHTCTKR